MIIINYRTSSHYEENVGDKHYCKSITSAKRKLKELLKDDNISLVFIKEILYKFDGATTYTFLNTNIGLDEIDLYINVHEEELV